MVCEKCGKEFFEDWRRDKETRKTPCRFCSRSCANSKVHSKETKEKIRDSINEYNEKNGTKREKRYCEKCGKELSYNNKRGLCVICATKKTRESYKYCKKCGKLLQYNNKTGICVNCNQKLSLKSEKVKEWRKRRKELLVEYRGGRCEICGYNKCLSALEFHHINEEEKDFGISAKNIVSMERYKEEVDKCILVCANCHREIHAGLIGLE